MDTGDTAWVLASTALVLFMTPGLALFYGGMVRAKNVLGTLMHSVFAMGLMAILWVVVGYTLAFGTDVGGLIGGFDFLGFKDVGAEPHPAGLGATIPHSLFATFQMMFAIITPALITGAFAERIKFSGYVVFISLWLLLVYSPVAHWVWHPEGWLFVAHREGARWQVALEGEPAFADLVAEALVDAGALGVLAQWVPHVLIVDIEMGAVSGLARSLNIATTAEGVETREQVDILRTEGCTELQGYYFGRPAAASEVAQMVVAPAPRAINAA